MVGRHSTGCITLGGNEEVATGQGRAGLSRGLPPCDLACRGAEAENGVLLACPF